MTAPIPQELAARAANAAAAVEGVSSAVICSSEGAVLGAAGAADPAREAALASFVALRAEALPVDGDLRGMGKQLAGSRFEHMTITGAGGECMIYRLADESYLSVRIAPGRGPAAAGPLAAIVNRVSNMPARPGGGS